MTHLRHALISAILAAASLLAGCSGLNPSQAPGARPPCCSDAGKAQFARRLPVKRSALPGLSRGEIARRLAGEDFSQFYDREGGIDVIAVDPRRVALIPDVAEDIRSTGTVPLAGSCGTPLRTGLGLCPGSPGIVERYKTRINGPFVAMNVSFFGEHASGMVRAIAGDVVINGQLKVNGLRTIPMPDAYHRMLLGLKADGSFEPKILRHTASCGDAPYHGLKRSQRPWPCAAGGPARRYEPARYAAALGGLGDPYDPWHLPGAMARRTVKVGPGQFASYPVARVVVGITADSRLIFAHSAGRGAREVADMLVAAPYHCDRSRMAFLDGGTSTHVFVRFRGADGRLQETELPAPGDCQNVPVWLVMARRSDVIHEGLADFRVPATAPLAARAAALART